MAGSIWWTSSRSRSRTSAVVESLGGSLGAFVFLAVLLGDCVAVSSARRRSTAGPVVWFKVGIVELLQGAEQEAAHCGADSKGVGFGRRSVAVRRVASSPASQRVRSDAQLSYQSSRRAWIGVNASGDVVDDVLGCHHGASVGRRWTLASACRRGSGALGVWRACGRVYGRVLVRGRLAGVGEGGAWFPFASCNRVASAIGLHLGPEGVRPMS